MLPNVRAEFQRVDKRLLLRPVYQRTHETTSLALIRKIQRNFLEPLFGALIVVRRPNGDLAVIDGLTRLTAVSDMDSISDVPCLIYKIGTIAEEAAFFRAFNRDRVPLPVHADHTAAVWQGEETALAIQILLDRYGRTASRYAKPNTISCIRSLRQAFNADDVGAERIFELVAGLCQGEALDRYTFDALFYIEQTLRDNRPGESLATTYFDRVIALGHDGILNAIKAGMLSARKFEGNRRWLWGKSAAKALKIDLNPPPRPRGRPRKQPETKTVEIQSQIGRRHINGGLHA